MNTVGVRRSEGSIEGVGRVRLHFRISEVQNARGALLVTHGLGEHAARYDELAASLTACGISTFAYDQRGHGRSDGRRGHVRAFDVLLQDLDRFRREVVGMLDPAMPLFLLGQSMGGLIALRYLEEYDAPLAGAILCSPWLGTAVEIPRWQVTAVSALTRLLPALPFRNRIDPERLSRDPAVVRAYREDPLVHSRITPRLFTEASAAMGLVQRHGERITVPLLFLLAGADRIVDTQRALSFARSLASADVTIREYPGHYHELLNELDRAAIVRDLRDWLAARLR
jgi:alpha-beta hydrolase superfamily lysophospholipase